MLQLCSDCYHTILDYAKRPFNTVLMLNYYACGYTSRVVGFFVLGNLPLCQSRARTQRGSRLADDETIIGQITYYAGGC